MGQGAKGTSGVISTIDQANGTIGYADLSQAGDMGTVAVKVQAGDMGTVAVKVGGEYTEISADAASKAVADSKLDESVPGANRVVLDINHATTEPGAYPIVLVSYDIACPIYRDENTARFAKSWLGGANRVVLDINHATTEPGAYPIVLVSYDIACPIYRDENTARFAKSWLGYITGKAGQDQAKNATGSAPLPENIAQYVRASIDAIEVK